MDNELLPELYYDNGLYYPTASNYYGYVCTGMEPTVEWDEYQKLLHLDGQDVQFSGLQTENMPCVYYTPSYDYVQSPYNPFNPYIPGAVVGTDGSYMGTQQCFTSSPFLQSVSPPAYVPLFSQSGSDPLLNASPNPMLFNNGAIKYAPPLSSMSVTTTPLKVAFENLSLEPSHSSSYQFQLAGRLPEGVVNATPRKNFLPYGDFANASGPQVSQLTEHSSRGVVPSVRNPFKVALPTSNGFTNQGFDVHGWSHADRMRPRNPYTGFPSRILGEQNMGPRSNKPRAPLMSPIALKAYTSTGNLDGNIVVHADQYNREDFSLDYLDAKFFVIKSYSEDDVHKSIKYNVWSSTSSGNKKLDIAYEEVQRTSVGKQRQCPVFLFFSVNASGHFCGVAEMVGPVDFNKDMDFWLQDKWTGSFPVKWHIIKDVPNLSFRHIILVNNELRPVTSSRDTQEVYYLPGVQMLTVFKNFSTKTSILDDFMYYEERQRIMMEEKSLILGRTSYEATVSPPLTSVPSFKSAVIISHPLKADDLPPSSAVTQPPDTYGQETDVKVDHVVESERTNKISDTGDQDQKADEKQVADELEQLDDAGTIQISKASAHLSGDANRLAESDARQVDHRPKNQSLEAKSNTKSNEAKNQNVSKNTDGLEPNNCHAIIRDAKMDQQDEKEGLSSASGGSSDENNSKKVDDGDVLTVGSMQIKISDANKCISGTLTIGSIPVDTNGSK